MFKKVMKLHFVGIGGSGMSGIAEVLLNSGYPISGSDKKKSDVTARLEKLGAVVFEGHKASNVGDAEGVVVSNAVPDTNPEVMEARRKKIPVIPRAQMLNELMRLKYGVCIAGTHGKTTTTSMAGLVLKEGGLDPTIVIGGVLDSVGSNTLLGKGDYFVVEACEAFASFLQLSPAVCVVTNIDNDHLDHYQNMDNLRDAFVRFINKVPFYGFALVCGDDPEIQKILPRLVRRYVTYGFGEKNDLRCVVDKSEGLTTSFSLYRGADCLGSALLKMPASTTSSTPRPPSAWAWNWACLLRPAPGAWPPLRACAGAFRSRARRTASRSWTITRTIPPSWTPHSRPRATRSKARLAASSSPSSRICSAAPSCSTRSSPRSWNRRTKFIFGGIYPSRETPIPGVSSELIVDIIEQKGKPPVAYSFDRDDLLPKIMKSLKAGDLFVTAGAGTIDGLGDKVLAELKKRTVNA